jgi:hypothetical protein
VLKGQAPIKYEMVPRAADYLMLPSRLKAIRLRRRSRKGKQKEQPALLFLKAQGQTARV